MREVDLYQPSTCTGKRLNILLPLTISNDLEVPGIVDTASQVTVLSEEVFQQLKNPPAVVEEVLLRGAAKQGRFPARKLEGVNLTIGTKVYRCFPYVAPISDHLLIGLDFLTAHAGVIDVGNQSVSLDGNAIPTSLSDGNASAVRTVRVTSDCHIPAFSCMLIPCFPLESPVVTGGATAYVSNCTQPNTLAVVPTVVPFNEPFKLPVLNETAFSVGLASHSTVALAEPAQEVECLEEQGEVRAVSGDHPTDGPASGDHPTGVPAHLQELFERSTQSLDDDQAEVLRRLLNDYADVFARNDQDLGLLRSVKHRIDTAGAKPIKQPMRRTPLGFEAEEEKHLQDMLRNDVIRPSHSSWASPPVLVRKKDGTVRWCIDYRRLNEVTVKDVFPLPLIEQCLDTLSGHSWYSSLDMASGYWQLEIEEEDKPKTAFITKYGLFEHNRMAFGLCNAPATFQRAIQLVLSGLLWGKALAYIDDVIVLGRSFGDNILNLEEVLERFRQHHLKLKPRKCHLFQRKVEFLGHIIAEDGVGVDPAKVEKVVQWPVPRSVTELQSFLGFVNYHRAHLQDLAHIAQPLYTLSRSKQDFEWLPSHSEVFERLKTALVSAPVLAYPQTDGKFILDTDASDVAIGAVLSQVQDGVVRVIAFASNTLSPSQRNYCTTRKELVAVVQFTRHFRHYLLGRPFLVRTDHGSLTWLLRFKQINGQLARWLEELSQFDMTIVHRPGRLHNNADAMSRLPDPGDHCDCYHAGCTPEDLPCGGCTHCSNLHKQWSRFEQDVDDVIPLAVCAITSGTNWCSGYTTEELKEQQSQDPDLSPVILWLQDDEDPPQRDVWLQGAGTKEIWLNRSRLEFSDEGLLLYRWEGEDGQTHFCLVVPRSLVSECLALMHDIPGGGHYSGQKTKERAQKRFWWPFMSRDCENYIQGCARCNTSKRNRRSPRARLGEYHVGVPLERVHIDILGPFPVSRRGSRYILMIVDQFTKWLECLVIPDLTALTVASAFVDQFIARLGCPLQIHTDQGTNFESDLFQAICLALQIAKTRTTPYHPSSNGQVERMNSTLLGMVRCFVDKDPLSWDTFVPQLAGAIRATPNRTTGMTPNMMMLGREVMAPVDILFPTPGSQGEEPAPFVEELLQRLQSTHEVARNHIREAQKYQKKTYDLKVYQNTFNEGDLVYALDTSRQAGVGSKLKPIWRGPCLVEKVLSPVLYRLRDRKRSQVLHHDRIKPCRDRQVPMWLRRLRHQLSAGEPLSSSCTASGNRGRPRLDDDHLRDLRFLFESAAATPAAEPTPTVRTRTGREVSRPAHLGDYV
jgi:hypothetical protein